MTDEQILEKLGLSEDQACDLAQKVVGLTTAQVNALGATTKDPSVAAAALGPNCSASDLQRFLAARKGDLPGSALIYFSPQAAAE